MKLTNFFTNMFGRKEKSNDFVLVDAPSKGTTKSKNIFKSILLKFKADVNSRNAKLKDPEYDFATIRNAIDVESILRQAKEKYLQLIWKNGYSFIGKNQSSVEYVKMRLGQIAIMTGTPTSIFLDNVAEELITYHNVFIAVQRDTAMSGGKPYMNVFGKRVNPIAGLFVIPASHTKPVVDDKTGRLLGWKVEGFKDEDDKFFMAENIVHIYMSKATGNLTGTPMMIPVLDDIRALRKMEENAEALVYQHAIPLFKYIVGNKDNPTEDDNEITEVKSQVESSDPHGMFVIPFNHDIVAVGNGAAPLDVERYLRYFRQRIISGLGLSSVAYGEGDSANRGTALVQDKGLQDGAKKYIATIKTFIDELLINELLQEGNFDIMDPLDQVHLFTPEIDVDAKIAKETHVMALYQGNCISENEMRSELGKDPVSEEERNFMYWNLVGLQKALIMSSDEMSNLGTASTTGLDIPKGTATKVRPTNQQGVKKNSKPKANDRVFVENSIRSLYMLLSEKYESVVGDVIERLKDKDSIKNINFHLLSSFNDLYICTKHMIDHVYGEGWISVDQGAPTVTIPILAENYAKMLKILGKDATILLEGTKIKGHTIDMGDVINAFDSLRPRLETISKIIIEKSFSMGLASALLKQKGAVVISDTKGTCGGNMEIMDTINIDQIPPHGQNCSCYVAKKEQTQNG